MKSGEQTNCFPRDQCFCVFCYIAGNSLNLAVTAVAGNSALLPSDVIDFAMLPVKRFWRETVSLLDVM